MVLVTVVFLANIRAAGITLTAIPLSLVAAVIGLRLAGLSINSMTLGGFLSSSISTARPWNMLVVPAAYYAAHARRTAAAVKS